MTSPLDRQPCPDRILEDTGNAFGMGAVGGSVFHFVRGACNSPIGHRLAGGAMGVRMNAPRIGGNFAVWGSLFSTFDCAMVYARRKEDPWNSIVAGAVTGGLLSLRRGLLATGRSAVFGGVLLALIEGAGIMVNRVLITPPPPPPSPEDLLQYPAGQDHGHHGPTPAFLGVPPAAPVVVHEVPVAESSVPAGWLRGFFGRKQQDKITGGDLNSEVLEMNLPPTAVPSYD